MEHELTRKCNMWGLLCVEVGDYELRKTGCTDITLAVAEERGSYDVIKTSSSRHC